MRTRHLVFLSVLVAGCSSGGAPEPLWVGHLVPLSGPDRDRGDRAITATNLALAQAREDEFTVAGHPLGIRHADSAKGTARSEAVRLLAVNRARVILIGPGVAKPQEVLATARLHGALVVVLDELADLPPPDSAVIPLAADPARRGEALADFARNVLKQSKVALVVDESRPICAVLAEAFARAWRTGKGEARRWKVDDLLPLAQVEELTRWKPGVVLLALGAAPPAGLEKALATLAAGSVVLDGGEDGDGPPLRWLDRGKNGPTIYRVTAYSSLAPAPPASRKLLDELRQKQGRAPDRTGILALDAVGLLRERADLLRDLERTPELKKRRELLEELPPLPEFSSVTGTMYWKEGRPVRPLFVVRSRGGKEALVRQIEAKR